VKNVVLIGNICITEDNYPEIIIQNGGHGSRSRMRVVSM